MVGLAKSQERKVLIRAKTSADVVSLAEVPSPLHITLLFKCARHTVLLSVLPSTPFSDIKSLLLLALQTRKVEAIADEPVPPPDRWGQVEFGIPKDKKDLKKGFVSVEVAEGVKKKGSGNKAVANESPGSTGLVDGSILAFRFRSQNKVKSEEDHDEDSARIDDQGWNVEMPRYDDDEG